MNYVELRLADYDLCRVMSYTGGTTWLRRPDNQVVTIPGAPVEIRRVLRSGGSVMAQVYRRKETYAN
jgi:hypothetical protein